MSNRQRDSLITLKLLHDDLRAAKLVRQEKGLGGTSLQIRQDAIGWALRTLCEQLGVAMEDLEVIIANAPSGSSRYRFTYREGKVW